MFKFQPGASVYARAEILMNSDSGLIGLAWSNLREAWFGEQAKRLIVVPYDHLVKEPQRTLSRLYAELGKPLFEHDLQNVVYDEPDYDAHLGMPGLHAVRKNVEFQARKLCSAPAADGCVDSSKMDLTLLDIVSSALCHNPKTREAWANVKVQTAQVGVAKAAYLPTLNGTLQEAKDSSTSHGTSANPFVVQSDSRYQNAALTLNWVLYDFGARSASVDYAQSKLASAFAICPSSSGGALVCTRAHICSTSEGTLRLSSGGRCQCASALDGHRLVFARRPAYR